MKKSVRAMRMERHHKRMAQESKLSLVSLMDIFTILVFFLMLNASDVQVLQNSKSLTLPDSNSEQAARETLILMVTDTDLLVQGRKLVDVATILGSDNETIPQLQAELDYQTGRQPPAQAANTDEQDPGRAITIMGDKAIPYALLKKIMQSCAQTGYSNIALAVAQTEKSAETP
jgi:biopolymer transport protein TolR